MRVSTFKDLEYTEMATQAGQFALHLLISNFNVITPRFIFHELECYIIVCNSFFEPRSSAIRLFI